MMKKYMYLLIFVFLFMLYPNITKAGTCLNSEKVKWQELAKNINVSYDYTEYEETVVFSVKLSNLQPGLVIKDVKNQKEYKYNSSELIFDNSYYWGESYRFDIYVESGDCAGYLAYSKYVNLPFYNKYYKDELCKGIEEFRYCQKWTLSSFNYYEFTQKVEQYRQSLNQILDDDKNFKDDSIFDFILEIYLDYYYIILPIIILSIIIIIYIYNKKNDLF